MSFYTKTAMRLFSQLSESLEPYFTEVREDLKRARMKMSVQEYLSVAILTSFIIFIFELPALSFIFSFVFQSFLFGFITSFTVSIFLTVVFFLIFLNYPKAIIKNRSKQLERSLPFASLYLSTIAGSKLPLNKIFEVFSKFSEYGEITDEVSTITRDTETFGIDINTSLERAIDRTPSKNFKELLWGLLSINRAGGNLHTFLKENAKNLIAEYRRKLYEFSHQLTIFIEMYLTAVVLGAVFFVILTSIMAGIAGVGVNIIIIQFLLIFIFLPLVSLVFILLVRSTTPGGE